MVIYPISTASLIALISAYVGPQYHRLVVERILSARAADTGAALPLPSWLRTSYLVRICGFDVITKENAY